MEIGLFLVGEKNESEVKEILYYLSELAIRYEKEAQESDTKRIVEYVTEIGKAAAIARLELIVIFTLRLISLVSREACRQQMENASEHSTCFW